MVDFTENIESLEKMVWNFILNPDNEDNVLRPSNHDSLSREELITLINPTYFNDEVQHDSYKLALKFFKEFGKIPNRKELKSYLDLNTSDITTDQFNEMYFFNLKDFSYDYLYKYLKSFILLRNLNLTFFDLTVLLKTTKIHPDNIDSITQKVRDSINEKLTMNFSSGNRGLNFRDHASHIQIPKNGSPTGFPFFDKTQGGGWNPKTLVVFQGRPKVGKSTVLGNLASRSLEVGNLTGLVTVELSERKYMKRLGSNLLSIKGDDYNKITSEEEAKLIKEKLLEFDKRNGRNGDLYVAEFGTGSCTAVDIENHFMRIEAKLNRKFTVIIVDYINLMSPIKAAEGSYSKIKQISEELRGVAQRNNWCIITATQIRREDVNNFDLGMDSVAESFGLVHTVDALYGIMRSPLEKRMKINVIANRDDGYEGSYKFFQMKTDYFRLTEEIGINSEYYSDDEEIGQLEEEIREENNAISSGSGVTLAGENDYDNLFDEIK